MQQQHGAWLEPHRFAPGTSGNPKGRPKGSRHKLGEEFLADCLEAWGEYGKDALTRMAADQPAKFCAMMAAILPRHVTVDARPVETISEEELVASLVALRSICAARDAGAGASAAEEPGSAAILPPVPEAEIVS